MFIDKEKKYALYLPPHRECKQDAEVQNEDGPVDRDVECGAERAEDREECRAGRGQPEWSGSARCVTTKGGNLLLCQGAKRRLGSRTGRDAPELPFWQPPHERPEFIVPLTGEDGLGRGGIALLNRVGEEVLS